MWRSRSLSIQEYADFCARCDLSPALSPEFAVHCFQMIKETPRFVGIRDRFGELSAAFPALYGMVFPNALHKRAIAQRMKDVGDIGQPEQLFPILEDAPVLRLNLLSPMTSPLLSGRVRGFRGWSLRKMAIAKTRKHKKLTIRSKAFIAEGGEAHFSDEMSAREFADLYLELHCQRWGYEVSDLRPVKEQIVKLYGSVHGLVLTSKGEPVAAQLCFKRTGPRIHYVDFINSGVVKAADNNQSIGSVMMLLSLRRAEQEAAQVGRTLRYSFGFAYSEAGYKSVWAEPESTFVGL